jgi:hypothetical protein
MARMSNRLIISAVLGGFTVSTVLLSVSLARPLTVDLTNNSARWTGVACAHGAVTFYMVHKGSGSTPDPFDVFHSWITFRYVRDRYRDALGNAGGKSWREWTFSRTAFPGSVLVTVFRIPLWLPLLVFAAYLLAAFAVSRIRRRHHELYPLCARCGYNLTGLPESRCPECGTPFDVPQIEKE